ncbi:lysozyme inhibitor LprI family protein [Rhodobacter capsulatus]|uniref:lysozyme inhibitor LprI family protein n=1 Tax=Rhodobacter capsulatus TaxID=1061 RepID=UPI0003D33876|nr:lysozyme inhibitor LprI family protein [Rhodobacter capsulatus]ETD89805.1 hypothetical protein U713_07200 [Rhodobacter capsulatus YW2]
MRVLPLPLLIALGLPAAAQAGNQTADCMAQATTPAEQLACVGKSSEACRSHLVDAQPALVAGCITDEVGWWRHRLMDAEAAMQARAEKLDVPYTKQIAEGAPRLTDDFEAMRKAWASWAEKRCTFEAMAHRNSPRRMVYAIDCHLHLTAEQTLYLEAAAKGK